ncbi:hydroxymethylbilane synthase [Mangrovibacterium lignilyticum]|uniref:hydroxymethylbilane synthase n=1 Tax=Mangrovibacterium lignilyticum TaxID=2668052 RepID=UPI0013D7D039|nr:hydroxymethylbilane synthase [Mangrovibacterium lignilyticum]
MSNNTIKIGTRGSKLALWQATQVKAAISAAFPDLIVETIIIKTKGDIILDVSLSKIGDKGLFTKEIETALLNGEIDLAVHSLKDLPTELPEGLCIGGMLPRGEVRDVFISKDGRKLDEMTPTDRIATSSLRRKAQLLAYNPNLNIVDIRGNVDTRLNKMNEDHCDALLMAGAGIIRLGYDKYITEFLDPKIVLPAVSQGAVAIEIREDDEHIQRIIDAISDENTWNTTMAERWLLRTLEGGCQVPVACYSEVEKDQLTLTGLVASVDGKQVIRKVVTCPMDQGSEKAIELAESIIAEGGKEILDQIRAV